MLQELSNWNSLSQSLIADLSVAALGAANARQRRRHQVLARCGAKNSKIPESDDDDDERERERERRDSERAKNDDLRFKK